MSEPIKVEYVADHALMVEIQSNAYVSGVALPATLLAIIGAITVGVMWISVLMCLCAIAFVWLFFHSLNRSLEARSLAGAHAMAAMLSDALAQEPKP